MVAVPKKNGSFRPCIDSKPLNAQTEGCAYPMPNIHGLLDKLRGSTFFLTMASSQATGRYPRVDGGHSVLDGQRARHTRLLLWLKNAPAECSRIMAGLMGGRAFAQVYLDDIIGHSTSLEQHVEHLQLALGRLAEANMLVASAGLRRAK